MNSTIEGTILRAEIVARTAHLSGSLTFTSAQIESALAGLIHRLAPAILASTESTPSGLVIRPMPALEQPFDFCRVLGITSETPISEIHRAFRSKVLNEEFRDLGKAFAELNKTAHTSFYAFFSAYHLALAAAQLKELNQGKSGLIEDRLEAHLNIHYFDAIAGAEPSRPGTTGTTGTDYNTTLLMTGLKMLLDYGNSYPIWPWPRLSYQQWADLWLERDMTDGPSRRLIAIGEAIRAHDQRPWPLRWLYSLFTSIEFKRELFCYHGLCQLYATLITEGSVSQQYENKLEALAAYDTPALVNTVTLQDQLRHLRRFSRLRPAIQLFRACIEELRASMAAAPTASASTSSNEIPSVAAPPAAAPTSVAAASTSILSEAAETPVSRTSEAAVESRSSAESASGVALSSSPVSAATGAIVTEATPVAPLQPTVTERERAEPTEEQAGPTMQLR